MTYVYECDEGHTFETTQRITDEPLTTCTQWLYLKPGYAEQGGIDKLPCNAPCRRVIQPVPAHLSGRRWARDGYSS